MDITAFIPPFFVLKKAMVRFTIVYMPESPSPFQKNSLSADGVSFRIPPQNKDAEMSVLGSLMLDASAPVKIADVLSAHDFYHDDHRTIYETIIELFERRKPIDVVSVSSRLKEKGFLEEVGGMSYIAHLVNTVPSTAGIGHYADIVHKKRILRDLISASQHINQLGYREEADVAQLLDEAEQKIFSIAKSSLRQKFTPVHSALEEAFDRIDRLHKNTDQLRGVAIGFHDLDKILSGLQPSDLVVLACRPSLGKTAFALDVARNVALDKQIPVGIFSIEMSTPQLIDRFLAAEARIDLWKLRTGRIPDEEFPRLRDALDKLSKAPIFIDDDASTNILQIRTKARRLQAEHGLGLIIVDYLQLIQPRTPSDSMVMQITEISRSLKALARELNVPVLALSQLSRSVEQRHPPVPRLSDLRDSGSIEQDADVVMFIYREDRYKQSTNRPNQADILIEKHRNGPVGKATLFFNKEYASFSSLDKKRGDDIQW